APRVQPEIGTPPLSTGVRPRAASQRTWWPLAPESALVKVSGAVSAYVPPSRLTTMSPCIDGARSRIFLCAWVIEHGVRSAHVVAPPLGETCSVVTRAAEAGVTTTVNATSAPARAALNDLDTIVAMSFRW